MIATVFVFIYIEEKQQSTDNSQFCWIISWSQVLGSLTLLWSDNFPGPLRLYSEASKETKQAFNCPTTYVQSIANVLSFSRQRWSILCPHNLTFYYLMFSQSENSIQSYMDWWTILVDTRLKWNYAHNTILYASIILITKPEQENCSSHVSGLNTNPHVPLKW